MKSEGYEPLTEGYYGLIYENIVYPRAVGEDSSYNTSSVFYRVNGLIAHNSNNSWLVETIKTDPAIDEETFYALASEVIDNIVFIDTTLEELNEVYRGKTLEDY